MDDRLIPDNREDTAHERYNTDSRENSNLGHGHQRSSRAKISFCNLSELLLICICVVSLLFILLMLGLNNSRLHLLTFNGLNTLGNLGRYSLR